MLKELGAFCHLDVVIAVFSTQLRGFSMKTIYVMLNLLTKLISKNEKDSLIIATYCAI